MKRLTIIAACIAAALAAAAFGIWSLVMSDIPASDKVVPAVSSSQPAVAPESPFVRTETSAARRLPIQTSKFIEAKRFATVWPAASSLTPIRGNIVAGIVNHHFLAADLIARFFTVLDISASDVRRIIILSPDHFHAGRWPISVNDRDYATPDGLLMSDREFVAALVSSTSATMDDDAMFESEHGIGALAPFIKREFPDVKIVPIALDGKLDRGAARSFGEELAKLVDANTVIIVSSDMSHYLPEATALEKDETTISELKAFDEKFFSTAKDDHIDNGVALVVLAGIFDVEKIKPEFTLLDHGISSSYVSDKKNTTSYINGFWER